MIESISQGGGEGRSTVRWAVIGLGWMAQKAVLPAFRNAPDARLTALVSGDRVKLDALGERHDVERRYAYEEFGACLRSGAVDAVYIALPNHLHRDYTVRAAGEGVHVLCEKPMAVTVAECREMIEAAERGGVRLMIAYRLHFDPANLRAAEIVRDGTIGEPRYFSSAFSMSVENPDDIRLRGEEGGGPLYDIGIYCVNAARHLFRSEPERVWSRGGTPDGSDGRFREVPSTTASVLQFPDDRLAAFACSFDADAVDAYRIVGTRGQIEMDPAYDLNVEYRLRLHTAEGTREETFPATDQVGPQLSYFSRCLLERRAPEPDGREGLADVRVIRGLRRAMGSGRVVELEPFEAGPRPTAEQAFERPRVEGPELVKASPPQG